MSKRVTKDRGKKVQFEPHKKKEKREKREERRNESHKQNENKEHD